MMIGCMRGSERRRRVGAARSRGRGSLSFRHWRRAEIAGRGCSLHAGVGATTHKSTTIDREAWCSRPVYRCYRSVRSSRPSLGARRPISESPSPSATSARALLRLGAWEHFWVFSRERLHPPSPPRSTSDRSSPPHSLLSSSGRRRCSRCRCRVRGHVCPRGAGGYGARAGG